MIIRGDCIEEMKKLEENSVGAIVTDPPYGLEFMGKDWDKFGISEGRAKRLTGGDSKGSGDRFFDHRDGAAERGRYSEMTVPEKTSMQMFMYSWAKECLRVLKPGGFLLSFGGTRTYHRMACGIEDAGFEIRDTIMWLYGSGFPKSLNIGKQIDKKPEVLYTLEFKKWLGEQIEKCSKQKTQINEECGFTATSYCKTDGKDYWSSNFPSKEKWKKMKEVIGLSDEYDFVIRDNLEERGFVEPTGNLHKGSGNNIQFSGKQLSNKSVSEYAKEWEGWGTALKPACEPIVVARKPLSEKNVALNVLKWGTGGINIDACRIKYSGKTDPRTFDGSWKTNKMAGDVYEGGYEGTNQEVSQQGRFPANIILDEEAGEMLGEPSRFFYCAKASKSERNFGMEEKQTIKQFEEKKTDDGREVVSDRPHQRGASDRKNNHPTVKPIKLMEYLIKLISKENAIVLDPFTGSGTTGIACAKLNRQFIGFEKEEEYVKIAEARIKPYLEQRKL